MYKKISDYGIIGNLHSVALIALDGSIEWLCLPHIDSPSIFGALLDDEKGGRFSISPLEQWDSMAEYIPSTNILATRFRTRNGVMRLTDFMPVYSGNEEESDVKRHELYRIIDIMEGELDVGMTFEPRFNYARAETLIERVDGGVTARGNDERMSLSCARKLEVTGGRARARWRMSKGERLGLHLSYGYDGPIAFDQARAEKDLEETEAYWRNWLTKSETGRMVNLGSYKDMVNRSALVLKLLYYNPSGAIAAAATTSLPEKIGGVRNWDYRYTWVRDTSFTLLALFKLGHLSETEGYLRWIGNLLAEHGAGKMQIMYGLRGEEDLAEYELPHLEGYKGSRPVRIGNDAARQKQLDIYGEIMESALMLSDYAGKIDFGLWPFLRGVCEHVVEHWPDKDYGIWEVKGGPHSFVYSKVMCWVALDRGITIARRYGFPADLGTWEQTKRMIKDEVMEKGWNEGKQSFVQHYDTDALDASSLLFPLLGFLAIDDPRMASTIEKIRQELGHDGFLYRYTAGDGLPGGEGVFLLCTFWLIDCLIARGDLDEAEKLIARMQIVANHLGLFAEEYDVRWKEPLGNFPQAFTHIGYINSVISLMEKKQEAAGKGQVQRKLSFWERLLGSELFLNDGEPRQEIPSDQIAFRLKACMNILRGAFFSTAQGRVAYESMRDSNVYREYVELSYSLKKMNLKELRTREEQIAFWINLYNVLVIHGVIELGIRDSVKEVRNFFKRIRYRIGDYSFTPDDIEHGILRGNVRPPHSFFKEFGGNDPRLEFTVKPVDPRIHFALVCASSSCPPIDVYTPENLGRELIISGNTFLNAGGLKIDRDKERVSLSLVFKWYGADFGKSEAEKLRLLSQFLYREEDKKYLEEKAETLKVVYQSYDWRLNRD